MSQDAMIGVQTVVQCSSGSPGSAIAGDAAGDRQVPLLRQAHRVAEGTTVRQLLQRSGLGDALSAIEAGRLGLAIHGRRAWLDDVLVDGSRVEVVAPIEADAKAARVARAAADRSRRRSRLNSVR